MTDPFIESVDHVLLVLKYKQECRQEQTPWEVQVQTHPRYADDTLDEPITLRDGDKINCAMDVLEAESVGKALLRAVEIRRKAVAEATAQGLNL